MSFRIPAALAVLLWTSASGVAVVGNGLPAALPVRIAGGAYMLAPVSVAGGSSLFLVDTGATVSQISGRIAKRAHARPVDRLLVTSPGGTRALERVRIDVEVAGMRLRDVEAVISDLDAVRTLDPAIEGILGQNVLRGLDVILDYERRRLWLGEAGALDGRMSGTIMPIDEDDGRPIVAVGLDGTRRRLVLDSGASEVVLFDTTRRLGDGTSGRLRSSGGERDIRVGRAADLSIGPVRWTNVRLAVVPSESDVDGLLPARLFRAVFVSASRGLARINPDTRALY